MSTDTDEWFSAELERSFGAEPPLTDPREHAARGRRTQRRRRAVGGAVGIAAAAAVTVLAVGGSTPGGTSDRGVEPAEGGGAAPVQVTAPVPVDPRTAEKCAAGSLGKCGEAGVGWDDLHLDRDGHLLRGYDDVDVTGHFEQVLTEAYGTSAAVEVTADGQTVWALITRTITGSSSGMQTGPPDPTRTFDQWVRDSMASGAWFSYRPDPDGPGEGATPR